MDYTEHTEIECFVLPSGFTLLVTGFYSSTHRAFVRFVRFVVSISPISTRIRVALWV